MAADPKLHRKLVLRFVSVSVHSIEGTPPTANVILEVTDEATAETPAGVMVGVFHKGQRVGEGVSDTWGTVNVSVSGKLEIEHARRRLALEARAQGWAARAATEDFEWDAETVARSVLESSDPALFFAAGLEWQRHAARDEMDWDTAKTYAANLALAGGGWRLPTETELLRLHSALESSPKLAKVVSAGDSSIYYWDDLCDGFYWSSTPCEYGGAIYVALLKGVSAIAAEASRRRPLGVRCVREKQ